jgi:hypothetical protein
MRRALVLVVALALLSSGQADDKKADSLTVVNEKGKKTALSPEAFAKLPRQTVKVKNQKGDPVSYEGVALAEVLRAADVTLGKDLRGPLLANFLLVEAADDYRVVFALPEVDPDLTDKVVLLADHKDGKPLAADEGPYRVVVPDDKRPSRWVKRVTRLGVRAGAPAAGKGGE